MRFKTPSRAAATLSLGMFLLAATTLFAQQLSGRRSGDSTTTQLVADMVSRYHISQKAIDDTVSEKLLKKYVEQLDPQKLYFVQADIDALQQYRHKLDDQLKAGQTTFAYEVFDLYLKRLTERIALAEKLVDAEYDFSVDETMVSDPKDLSWAKTDAEVQDRWRKRVKYDLLTLKLDDTKLGEARERLHKRYHNIQTTMQQTEPNEKLEMFLTAFCETFDPHSSYMSPETLEDFQIQMRLSLEGIGAALRSEEGYTTVASVVPGGAAAEDGRLKVGDKIIGVGQATGEIVDVVEMKLSRVVRLIRGEKGTIVRLQVKKGESGEIKLIDLTRKTIALKESEVRGEVINTKDRFDGPNVRVGVVHIPSFYRDFEGARLGGDEFKSTSRDVRVVLDDFRQQGVDVVVVDLRMNGGGALAEAIEVSGLFIDKGPVVQVKEQDGAIKSHDDTDTGVAWNGPLVVICNRLSASASEIFAGAIKDYGRGIIVGDTTTHGKGTVQNVMPVSRQLFRFLDKQDDVRGALKLTINQFYRVNGDSTQNRGVESDIVLPSLIDHMDLGESFLENALEFDRVNGARHVNYGLVSPEMVSELQQSSQQRMAGDKDFAEIQQEIQKFVERKTRKTVSLNESVLRAERANDKKEQKDEELDQPQDGPIFPDKPYNNEVLRIASDYAGAVKNARTALK